MATVVKLVDAPTPVGPASRRACPALDSSVLPVTLGAMSIGLIVWFLMSPLLTWLFLMCLLRTAFLRMSLAPTFVTAYDVPLSATNSAIMAIDVGEAQV